MKLVKIKEHYYLLSGDEIRPEDWYVVIKDLELHCHCNGGSPFIGGMKVIASTQPLMVKGEKEGDNTWVTKVPLLDRVRTERHIIKTYIDRISNASFEVMGYHSTVTLQEESQYKRGWKMGFRHAHAECCEQYKMDSDALLLQAAFSLGTEWNVKVDTEWVRPDPDSVSQFEPFMVPKVTEGFINITRVL
jgi:hypothetical protein